MKDSMNAINKNLEVIGILAGIPMGTKKSTFKWTLNNTTCETWFERDRASVLLVSTEGDYLFELWDEDVENAIEDGFLDPSDYHASALKYFESLSS